MAADFFNFRMSAMDARNFAEAMVEVKLAEKKLQEAISSQGPDLVEYRAREARAHLNKAVKAVERFERGQFSEAEKD